MRHDTPSGLLPNAPCRARAPARRWPQKTGRPETALPRLSPSTIMSPAPRPRTKLRLDPRAAATAPTPVSRAPPGLDAAHRIQLRGETIGSQRRRGSPGRARARRRQPQRSQAAERHARLDPDRAPRPERDLAAGHLPRPGLRQRRLARAGRRLRAHPAHPQPRRGDQAQGPHSRLARAPLGRRGLPLMAQPQPRDPDPLVEERREPPRPAPTRRRPDRLQESPRRPTRPRPSGIGP